MSADHTQCVLPHINTLKCNACGDCVALCPTSAVEIVNGVAVVTHPDACTYCDVCESYCLTNAIERPFVIAFAHLVSDSPHSIFTQKDNL
jgi:NAD-dependent dihydropyrimidine dehydrogenase PreA subunit